jgi:hypothetical protein
MQSQNTRTASVNSGEATCFPPLTEGFPDAVFRCRKTAYVPSRCGDFRVCTRMARRRSAGCFGSAKYGPVARTTDDRAALMVVTPWIGSSNDLRNAKLSYRAARKGEEPNSEKCIGMVQTRLTVHGPH